MKGPVDANMCQPVLCWPLALWPLHVTLFASVMRRPGRKQLSESAHCALSSCPVGPRLRRSLSPSLSHPPTNSLTHSLTYSFPHPLTHSLTWMPGRFPELQISVLTSSSTKRDPSEPKHDASCLRCGVHSTKYSRRGFIVLNIPALLATATIS